MSTRRSLLAALTLVAAAPAALHAQIAEANVPPPAGPPSLTAYLEATADRPEFAAQRVATRLQNVAEVMRQFGETVTRADTAAYGVTRLPEVNGYYATYPPPPYVARYVVRVRLASGVAPADVQAVSTALARAGATAVTVAYPRADR